MLFDLLSVAALVTHCNTFLHPQVKAFCDVDQNKIQRGFYTYEESKVSSSVPAGCRVSLSCKPAVSAVLCHAVCPLQERPKPRIPVVHYAAAAPPLVVCVKLVSRETGKERLFVLYVCYF